MDYLLGMGIFQPFGDIKNQPGSPLDSQRLGLAFQAAVTQLHLQVNYRLNIKIIKLDDVLVAEVLP